MSCRILPRMLLQEVVSSLLTPAALLVPRLTLFRRELRHVLLIARALGTRKSGLNLIQAFEQVLSFRFVDPDVAQLDLFVSSYLIWQRRDGDHVLFVLWGKPLQRHLHHLTVANNEISFPPPDFGTAKRIQPSPA